jgi:hypothetical protein
MRLIDADGVGHRIHAPTDGVGAPWSTPYLPDLEDPATLGCLLGRLKTVYEDETLHVEYDVDEWLVWMQYDISCVLRATTYAEALVVALEKAP